MVLVGVVVLGYPFTHLRAILTGDSEYSRARVIFLAAWMFVASVVIMEFAALFAISVY